MSVLKQPYKVIGGTAREVMDAAKQAHKEFYEKARAFAAEVGAQTDNVVRCQSMLDEEIIGLFFDSEPPKGWEKKGNYYVPDRRTRAGKEYGARIASIRFAPLHFYHLFGYGHIKTYGSNAYTLQMYWLDSGDYILAPIFPADQRDEDEKDSTLAYKLVDGFEPVSVLDFMAEFDAHHRKIEQEEAGQK